MPESLLLADEVAEFLRVDAETVQQLVHDRALEAYQIAGELRFSRAQLQKFLQQNHIPQTTSVGGNKIMEPNLQEFDQDMRDFVQGVLNSIPDEPRRNIIDRTFLAIQNNPEWLKHYEQLVAQYDVAVINSNIGRYVRTLKGFDNRRTRQRAKSRLIQSYSELA